MLLDDAFYPSSGRLRSLGLQPRTKEQADGTRYPFVLFAAPPSGSEDYAAEVRARDPESGVRVLLAALLSDSEDAAEMRAIALEISSACAEAGH